MTPLRGPDSSDQKNPDDVNAARHGPIRRTVTRCGTICRECRVYDRILPAAFLSGVALALLWYVLFSPPRDLATPAIIKIGSDQTLSQISQTLKTGGVIRWPLVFELVVRALGDDTRVRQGSYFLPAPENIFTLSLRLLTGDFELNPVRVYVPEGSTVRAVTNILADRLAPFDTQQFLSLSLPDEGELFPDTYYFFPGQEPNVVERAMQENFMRHIAPLRSEIQKSGHSLRETATMASILVGEAGTDEDRRIVAGVLWKRISLGIPLQVDAPFGYVLNKPLTQLTSEDLKIDSPYNTYTNKGLPPTPINNPGFEAIEAALNPIRTSYLYYLSDNRGTMHYSATFAQHEAQINEYLR